MRFTISTQRFLKELTLVSKAISSTTPLPILLGILLEAKDNKLTLTASDASISIRSTLISNKEDYLLDIKEEGTLVINARMLMPIIQKTDADTVDFELIDSSLIKITSGKSEFKINTYRGQDYPNISFTTNGSSFSLSTVVLNDIKNSVAFAVSNDLTRPSLTGVNLKAEGKKLRCAATDSYRMATKEIELAQELNFDIVLPARYLEKVTSSLEEVDNVNVTIDRQKIIFTFNQTIISARLIDDAYPDITHLLPKEFKQILKINARDLLNSIDRTTILRYDGKNTIKLKINQNNVEISAVNQEVGSSRENLNLISYSGDDLTISCSGKYLSDAIRVLRCEEVTLSFNGELRPIIITGKDNSLILFVSPVRSWD